MKLYTKTHKVICSLGETRWDHSPVGEINNYKETEEFFRSLFCQDRWVKDIEFADIGKHSIIRAKFWRGPFNECPIHFEYQSGYTKTFSVHNLLNAVLGCLSQSGCYFLRIDGEELLVDKILEYM